MRSNLQEEAGQVFRKSAILSLKGPKTVKMIRERTQLYDEVRRRGDILKFQTQRFNEVWSKALRTSPFYRRWSELHSLPGQITDIRDVSEFPPLTKSHISENSVSLLDSPTKAFYLSGGSTGVPTRVPRGDYESISRYANTVVARSWLSLAPGDRYVHLWGHAHLFGHGKSAAIRKQVRKAKDWLVGGYRLNAYSQTQGDMRDWLSAIERIRPKYLVGYTSALVNVAEFAKETTGGISVPGLQWIIPTAETVTSDDAVLLRETFGAPIAVEYGAVESGLIAHSRPHAGEKLQVLWASVAGNVADTGALRLSTLDPREFPLINYEIGDEIEDPDNLDLTLNFGAVSGRIGEELSLQMQDGGVARVNMGAIVNALKSVEGVRAVQAAQTGGNSAEIYVTSSLDRDRGAMKSRLLGELRKANIDLDSSSLNFVFVRGPVKSVAGKVNRLVPPQIGGYSDGS